MVVNGFDQIDPDHCHVGYRSHRELPGQQERAKALLVANKENVNSEGGSGLAGAFHLQKGRVNRMAASWGLVSIENETAFET